MSEEIVVAGQYLHSEIPNQPVSVTDKKLNVKASDLETLLGTLNSNVATQTTLAAILNKIIAAPSTAEKQDLIKGVLDTIAGKDYATQTTLDDLKQKIDDLYDKVDAIIDENDTAKVTVSGTLPVDTKDVNSDTIMDDLVDVKEELALVKAELQAIKTNQTSGDQKVQQVGTIATLYSMNFADRPLYTEITEPTVFVLMNSAMDMWWTDGSADWVVI
jgi:hypothetical protein